MSSPPPPPPPTSGSASFKRAMEDDPDAARSDDTVEKRARTLTGAFGNKTVREAFTEHFAAHGIEAIPTLALSIGARPLQIQKFYGGREDDATKQRLAMPALEYMCQCEFRTVVITTETLLELIQPLLVPQKGVQIPGGRKVDGSSGNTVTDDRTMDMSFLDQLRVKVKERFPAARRIYVRDSMREVFGRFRVDALQDRPSSSWQRLTRPGPPTWFTTAASRRSPFRCSS
jgi:hypothetical protein